MASGLRWKQQMAEEFWLAEERKEEKSYPFLMKDGIKDSTIYICRHDDLCYGYQKPKI